MNRIRLVADENYDPDDPDAIIVEVEMDGRVVTVRRRDLEEPQGKTRPASTLSAAATKEGRQR